MKVTKVSILTGITHTREIDCTEAQVEGHRRGMTVQAAFPQLDAEDREFMISGITPEEWEEHMVDEEEEQE